MSDPEAVDRMCKKISQLTRVIYLLNTKNRAMKTKPSKSKSEKREAKKLKKLKHVIKLVNKKKF